MTETLYRPRIRMVSAAPGIQLTYALRSDPAPLTASISTTAPVEASLELIITNGTGSALAVAEIDINIEVGTQATDLVTQTTANSGMTIEGIAGFTPQTPGAVTQGSAMFSAVATTGSVPIAPGASFVVTLFNLPVNTSTGTTTITIAESIGQAPPSPPTVTFELTKFPYGFFLNDFVIAVASGSNFTPAAQVARGKTVTLLWDGSQSSPSSYSIIYSTNDGQKTATPTSANLWISPALSSDTTFVLTMSAPTSQGGTVSETLSATVSVQTPDLVANDVAANGTITASGDVTANAITANGGLTTKNGLTVAGTSTLTGSVTIDGGANISGNLVLPGTAQFFGVPTTVAIPNPDTNAAWKATSDGFLVVNAELQTSPAPLDVLQLWIGTSNADGSDWTTLFMFPFNYAIPGGRVLTVAQSATVPIRANTLFWFNLTYQAPPNAVWARAQFFPIGQSGTLQQTVQPPQDH